MASGNTESYVELLRDTVAPGPMRDWAEAYARRAMRRVEEDVALVLARNPKSVINVGAAPFMFEFLVRKVHNSAIDLVAIDIDPDRLGRFAGELGVALVKGNVETDAIDVPSQADIVVWTEMIEHCRIDLIGTTKRVAGLAKPGGSVYLTTPNGRSLTRTLRFLGGRTGRSLIDEWSKLQTVGHMGHVREYSRKELDEFFIHCGLSISDFRTRPALRSGGRLPRRVIRRLENVVPRWRDSLVYVLSPG